MSPRIGDLLKQQAKESFVGRSKEKAALLEMLEKKRPIVLFVYQREQGDNWYYHRG